MDEGDVLDVLREGMRVALIVGAPVLAVALVAGLVIGLFQALTSVQEVTLTFVPKLAAILVAFWISMAFSGRVLVTFFNDQVLVRIAGS